jgi:hypothetical protein
MRARIRALPMGCTGDLAADRGRLIMTSEAEIILRFEMGYIPAEFRQRLPALADVEYDPARSQFDHVEDGRRWSLRLSEPRERVIGSLRVPRVDVEFVFQRYESADINSFMTRFHAHFRRGGG